MKNYLRIVFLIAVGLTAFNRLGSQTLYPSKKIMEVYQLLPANCKIAIEEKKSMCKYSYQGDSLQINFDYNENYLTSAGLQVFNSQDKKHFPPVVYNFVEMFFLKYFLTDDQKAFFAANDENRIKLYMNGSELLYNSFINKPLILDVLINSVNKSSSFKEDMYQFHFNKSNFDLSFSFPANNLLIHSMDKKEADLFLAQSLKYFDPGQKFTPLFDTLNLTKGPNGVFFSNERILHKGVSNQYFLRKADDGYSPIFEKAFYCESLQNEFLVGFADNQKKLNINHQQYGHENDNYALTLKDFLQYFRQDNDTDLYFGIESDDEKMLVASLFIKHKYLNSLTILTVMTNTSDMFYPEATYNCKLYSNIPGDNIKDLFGIYDDNTSDKFFKINSR